MNIAAAESAGWTTRGVKSENCLWINPNDTFRHYWLPNYHSSHDAVAELRKNLNTQKECDDFITWLFKIVGRRTGYVTNLDLVDSLPSEQLESYLRTKGLWRE